jgi:hypothetical protein
MPLARLNVMVGVAKLERITKSDPDFPRLPLSLKPSCRVYSQRRRGPQSRLWPSEWRLEEEAR